MKRKELIKKYVGLMKQWQEDDEDVEAAHGAGDDLLCELLVKIDPGFKAVVKEYNDIEKWYA